MTRRLLLLLCLAFLATPLFCGPVPPFDESVDLTLVTLNRMTLRPMPARVAGLLPKKAKSLPASARLFLRATGELDLYSPTLDRAAARIRYALAPRLKDKDVLRDSPAVAKAVGLWLDAHLIADTGTDSDARPSLDWRKAYPKVSTLLRQGHADGNGRALVATALLRILKVPARVAFAKGALTVQYWVAAETPKSHITRHSRHFRRRPHAPRPPLGWWACMDPGLKDYDVDAWSLDPSSLACMRWKPDQDLSVSLKDWERVAFPQDDSAAARSAFDASLASGFLTRTAQAGSLSVTACAALAALDPGQTRATVWVLTAQHWRLSTEGALQGLSSVEMLTPYCPNLSSWGREQRGELVASELSAQGVWSDRPARLRLHKTIADEWSSPPPAIGILHWYDLGVRRQETVLEASRLGALVHGVVFRGDNLSPRRGWLVRVQDPASTQTASARVDASGRFSVALSPNLAQAECLDVATQAKDEETIEQRLLLKQ
ncbi:MAG: hypothetical protein ACREKE_00390 [bacterium]